MQGTKNLCCDTKCLRFLNVLLAYTLNKTMAIGPLIALFLESTRLQLNVNDSSRLRGVYSEQCN